MTSCSQRLPRFSCNKTTSGDHFYQVTDSIDYMWKKKTTAAINQLNQLKRLTVKQGWWFSSADSLMWNNKNRFRRTLLHVLVIKMSCLLLPQSLGSVLFKAAATTLTPPSYVKQNQNQYQNRTRNRTKTEQEPGPKPKPGLRDWQCCFKNTDLTSSYLSNLIVCSSFVKYATLLPVDFVIGHMLQTRPLLCERTHGQIGKPLTLINWVDNHRCVTASDHPVDQEIRYWSKCSNYLMRRGNQTHLLEEEQRSEAGGGAVGGKRRMKMKWRNLLAQCLWSLLRLV